MGYNGIVSVEFPDDFRVTVGYRPNILSYQDLYECLVQVAIWAKKHGYFPYVSPGATLVADTGGTYSVGHKYAHYDFTVALTSHGQDDAALQALFGDVMRRFNVSHAELTRYSARLFGWYSAIGDFDEALRVFVAEAQLIGGFSLGENPCAELDKHYGDGSMRFELDGSHSMEKYAL